MNLLPSNSQSLERDPFRCATRSRSTRRQLLAAGVSGWLGCSFGSRFSLGARSPDLESQTEADHVLEPSNAAEAGMSSQRLARIVDRLHAETNGGGVRSASILVARHGKIVLHRGFGKLNQGAGAAETQPDTIYLLASISKPVSVCGLMLLVERGQVLLSDPVQRYLPEFKGPHKDRVQVWHLLSHVSGMPDMLPENVGLRRAHAPLSEFVAGALETPLLYEPATQFRYQSMGTLLAGEIAERVYGAPLRELLRREIFDPLGMKGSVLGLDGLKIDQTAIFQTNSDSDDTRSWGANSPYWRDMGHPWGGMHSTTGDLAILLQTFLNGGQYNGSRILSPTTTAAMTRDYNQALKAPWGLGWALRDSRVWNFFGDLGSAGTFGHVGSTGTVAWADPARQLICILLSTRSASYQGGFLLNSVSNMVQAAVT